MRFRRRSWLSIWTDRLTILIVESYVPIRVPSRRLHHSDRICVPLRPGLLPHCTLPVVCSSLRPLLRHSWSAGPPLFGSPLAGGAPTASQTGRFVNDTHHFEASDDPATRDHHHGEVYRVARLCDHPVVSAGRGVVEVTAVVACLFDGVIPGLILRCQRGPEHRRGRCRIHSMRAAGCEWSDLASAGAGSIDCMLRLSSGLALCGAGGAGLGRGDVLAAVCGIDPVEQPGRIRERHRRVHRIRVRVHPARVSRIQHRIHTHEPPQAGVIRPRPQLRQPRGTGGRVQEPQIRGPPRRGRRARAPERVQPPASHRPRGDADLQPDRPHGVRRQPPHPTTRPRDTLAELAGTSTRSVWHSSVTQDRGSGASTACRTSLYMEREAKL